MGLNEHGLQSEMVSKLGWQNSGNLLEGMCLRAVDDVSTVKGLGLF